MPEDKFPEVETPLHPINLVSYTLDTIPAKEISLEEANFWVEELSKTHRMEGSVILTGQTGHADTINQLLQNTEGNQRNRLLAGITLVGPAIVAGEVKVSGIGFWTPLDNEPSET